MARWVRIDLEPSGRRPAALVATLAYAFLMLMLWLIIFQILEIDSIVGLLERLIAVLPLIFVAVALVARQAAPARIDRTSKPYLSFPNPPQLHW